MPYTTPLALSLATTIVAIGAFAAPAAAAPTGVASVVSATKVQYKAAKGKQNRVVVTRSGNTVTIDDRVAVKAGKGCKKVKGDRTKVRCTPSKAPARVRVYTYDRNDSVTNRTGLAMTADGGTGSDKLHGGPRGDILRGWTGNDTLYGYAGNDTLDSDDGNDVIYAGPGDDGVMDSAGRNSGNDVVYGEGGYDHIMTLGGNDKVYGGADDDILYGGDGRDWIDGGHGNDRLQGDDCRDGSGKAGCYAADVMLGGSGVDLVDYHHAYRPVTADLDGASRDDGQPGEHDTIGADVEQLLGGPGNDRLTGNNGDNTISGWNGNDALFGGAGTDDLYGGAGRDSLDGGTHGPLGDFCAASTSDTRVGCERA
ncbi:calcium-binding protein [Actinoplanes sp. NPDC024001]|uniref:calcium-binding protein n=1 Tax=Actinoplanes sp. NPDC024001 TaxID=3154598 RepID=UPI0033D77B1E